MNSKVCRWTRS